MCLTLVPSPGRGRAICLLLALAYRVLPNLCSTSQVLSNRRRGSTRRRPVWRRIKCKMPATTVQQGAHANPPAPPKSVSSIVIEDQVEELEPDEQHPTNRKLEKPVKKALL
jgi:hypothetical protein